MTDEGPGTHLVRDIFSLILLLTVVKHMINFLIYRNTNKITFGLRDLPRLTPLLTNFMLTVPGSGWGGNGLGPPSESQDLLAPTTM